VSVCFANEYTRILLAWNNSQLLRQSGAIAITSYKPTSQD
jgi:hypothetical protein